jgi:hypothetical protein
MEPITGEDQLYRRIIHYQYNEETGEISASAFMKKRRLDPEVSVFLARLTDPRDVLDAGLPAQRLVALQAQAVYDIGLKIVPEPTKEFPGHCVIVGFGKNWKEQCLRLAEASRIVDESVPTVE